jgi:hypothetical protein
MNRTARPLALALTGAFIALGGAAASGAADDARAILIEAENRQRTQTQEYVGEVVVVSASGKEHRKTWRSYREGAAGSANQLIRFVAPPEVKGVGYLSRSRPGKPTEQWLYLPSMKRERRIASQDRDTSFLGTDFNYEDMEEFDHAKYDVSMLADEVIDGQPCYVIEMKPRNPSVYVKKIAALRKDRLTSLRFDLFRRGDQQPSKRLVLADYEQFNARWAAKTLLMQDMRKGSRTTVRLTELAFDRPQPQDRFTLQNLTREGGEDSAPVRKSGGATVAASRTLPSFNRPEMAPESPAGALAGWGLTGYVESKVFGYTNRSGTNEPRITSWSTLFVRKQARIRGVVATAAVRAELIPASARGPLTLDLADRRPARSPLSLREFSVAVPLASAIDFQVGRFEIGWGRTDVYSPADSFLPRDASDALAMERLPLWGARLQGERKGVRFDLYGAFVATPWRMPRMEGRYSPYAAIDYYLRVTPAEPPRGGFASVRILKTGERFDIGAWVRSGTRPMPVMVPDIDNALEEGPRHIVPTRFRFGRETGGGLEVCRTFDSWILRAEAAVLKSSDPAIGTTVPWSFEGEFPFRSGSITATFADNARDPPEDPNIPFQIEFFPGFWITVNQSESWGDWRVIWTGTFKRVGSVLAGEATRALTDTLRIVVGADMPFGAKLGTPGAYYQARRLRTSLRLSW